MLTIEHLHPIVVHFPIVLMLGLAAFDVLATAWRTYLSGRGCAAGISSALAVLAGIAAILAYVFGDIAYDIAVEHGVSETTLETHEGLGSITALAIVIWGAIRGIVWWRKFEIGGWRRWPLLAVQVGLAALIVVTAYFGGSLVYEHGVNVHR